MKRLGTQVDPQRPMGLRLATMGGVALDSARQLMQGADPWQTDQAVRALLSPFLASNCEAIVNGDYDVVGWRLTGDPGAAAATAAMQLAPFLQPMPANLLRQEIARLCASVITRNEHVDDVAMRLQVIAEECEDWPEDIARAALRGWARREKFFPSLAELRDELQRHGRMRRSLAAAIAAALPKTLPPPAS